MLRLYNAADERASISRCAPKDLNDDLWQYLETIGADYLDKFFRQLLLTKKRATQIENTARKLKSEIKGPAAADLENGWCLWSPKISVMLNLLGDLKLYAKSQQQPKSQRKKSNRARDDALDGYLTLLVLCFMQLGGHPGKSPSSPCAIFVDAAASPVLAIAHADLDGNDISDLIRHRVWLLAENIAAGRPQLETSALSKP